MSDFLALAGLALVDSLSVGTLVIPIALIFVWRRVRFGLLGAYLATIGGAYCGLGIALLFGFEAVVQRFSGVAEADWFRWVTLVLGVGLFLFGVAAPNPKKQAAKGAEPVEQSSVASVDAAATWHEEFSAPERGADSEAKPGTAAATITSAAALPDADVREGRAFRLARGVSLSVSGMVALALGAAVVEAATMLPYLGAMGIIQSMSVGMSSKIALIVGYCAVMILPAILMSVIAGVAGPAIFPRLERAIGRLEYEAKVTLLWIAAIVGFYMAYRSAVRLGLMG